RHRVKRKAYIEEARISSLPPSLSSHASHSWKRVTKLQTALGQLTFKQAAVLPPPLTQIRELEAENACSMCENHDLHR
ncbi:hypothetical protein B0H13DRAFT_1490289, partial [Mycena leptocephala]